jgi:APA family basic amino acid/polyamine antiporter
MAKTNAGLKRELTIFGMIAIASGGVLGGWLAEAPYWFQLTGAGAAVIFPILAVLLVPMGLAFSELTAMLPFASAVDVWSCNAVGWKTGWATQWMFFLVQVVEPPLVAYIFVTAIGYFFPLSEIAKPAIAILIMVVWYVVSNYQIEITGKLAIWLFVIMVGMTVIDSLYYFLSGHWHWVNISRHGGLFPLGFGGAIAGASALVLKYIGFGMTPTMIQETNFPARKMALVIITALFIPAAVYTLATIAIGGLAPYTAIAKLTIPEPQLIESLGMSRIIAALAIISGLLYAFTTLMGFWVSSARVLYGASQLKQLPPWFIKTNSHGQPYVANLVVLAFGVFFAIFTSTNWVQYMYSLSVVASGVVYFLVCLSAYRLRDKHPEWDRPYRAPAGKPMFIAGMIVSAAITIVGITLLPVNAWPPIIIYILIGILIPLFMAHYRRGLNGSYEPVILTPDDIRDGAGAAS